MKCIIGLGNPGKKYEKTRHNIGFMVIDRLSKDLGIKLDSHKFKSDYGAGYVNGERVMLVKPQTFMNLSGEGVRPLIDYYKIDAADILVLYDDLDLPVGKLRLRQKGSGGGHNGIKSLNQHLGTVNYKRIRIGIDRPASGEPIIGYVLAKFPKSDKAIIDKVIEITKDASAAFVIRPFQEVMTEYNGDVNER
ncbi:aminoacyl-tRNA hydrolase [Salinicoccus albus]|uniref:aminoacyl-tRNA hydrolase n=1 Tax=Salinicoccus albus TaxID=418756 RepID=UPI00036A7C23|nr:aminoacyl-tRNA hydrolase [Salinicoccus albus]